MHFSNIALDHLNYVEVLTSSDSNGNLVSAVDNLLKAFKEPSVPEPSIKNEIILNANDKKNLALLEDVDLGEFFALCAKKNLSTDSANTVEYEKQKMRSFIYFCDVLCRSDTWDCLVKLTLEPHILQ